MLSATLRFYAELNDFLPAGRRMKAFPYRFHVPGTVKDVIESMGVPHTEVDLIVVNGRSAGFDYRLRDGDRIAVYPVFESIDISPILRVRPRPLRRIQFVLDIHLGRLAAYLRLLGFDAVYRNDLADAELARLSAEQHRILLTRDRGLLKRSAVTHGHYVRATRPRLQLAEIIERFDLKRQMQPFTRCLVCNGVLEEVDKEAVAGQLPPGTRERFNDYRRCRSCGRVYWRGAHYRRMRRLVQEALTGR